MKNIVWKILLIVVVLVLCVWAIHPPKYDGIRLGKDLRGGVSLVYQVNLPPDADADTTIGNVISVLQDRVNPNGVLDITMTREGRDRLEVVMPLPNEEVRSLRKTFDDAFESLQDKARIREAALVPALAAGTATQTYGESGTIGSAIKRLQLLYDAQTASRRQLEEARAGGDEAAISQFEKAVANAELDYEAQLQTVLGLGVDDARIKRALNLSTERQGQRDPLTGDIMRDETGAMILIDSPRDIELADLRGRYSHLVTEIDAVVESWDAYASLRTGFDDPEDLMRLLRGAGVLEFHIAVQVSKAEGLNIEQLRAELGERGPFGVDSAVVRWYPINDLKQWYDSPAQLVALQNDPVTYFAGRDLVAGSFQGEPYLLLWTTEKKSMTHDGGTRWSLVRSTRTVDPLGRPAVGFDLDQNGALLMQALTAPHQQQPMAIVLDEQVYSAPTLQSAIAGSGQVTGTFSDQEIDYLIRVLAAGSLEARLTPDPISVSVIGPTLGKDNLVRGLEACWIAVIAVCVFMMIYYFFAGFVASLALLINGVLIFGGMSLIDGTFTLPGLAGIVLTIGMAVDANVLIYERIREELMDHGEDLRTAIRLGYQKALSTIIDGNVTNLIVCFVLLKTATTEVKGFAMTLSIGILATLFTALFVTRVIYTLYTELFKVRSLPMLPIKFPAIHRALEPSIDWIGMRYIFRAISIVLVLASLTALFIQGSEMLDAEFRGGVSATMKTRMANAGEDASNDGRLLLSREDVERELQEIGEGNVEDPVLSQLRNVSVVTLGDDQGFRSDQFQVKVATPTGLADEETAAATIVDAIAEQFRERLQITTPLEFAGRGVENHSPYTFAIEKPELGANIGRPEFTQSIDPFVGGVIVMVENIVPPATIEDVSNRLKKMRDQQDFEAATGRDVEIFGLVQDGEVNGEPAFREMAILVFDGDRSVFADFEQWNTDLAALEWQLASAALSQRSSLERYSTFSPVVARTQKAQAIVAVILSLLGILVYIWIRFGSLWYSLAAIVALVHDVIIALGLLAVSQMIGATSFASALLIEEFHIDLGVVAALLTIIGYSLNDTIVLLDRIRENRGKLPLASGKTINLSINQCISRTLLTSVTTLIAVTIMYVEGGTGIRPFTYTLLIGIMVGTYSSVAIAAPFVFRASEPPKAEEEESAVPATA